MPGGATRSGKVEATSGFEPLSRGFADLRVEPLHHVAEKTRWPRDRSSITLRDAVIRRLVAAPRGFEPRPTDPKSAVLPLDQGAAARPPIGSRSGPGGNWSGRRDSNPRPSPWQGDALPTEPLPLDLRPTRMGGAESQIRTGDTAIFSRVLYQLSYLGPMASGLGCPSAFRRIARASDHLKAPRHGSAAGAPAHHCRPAMAWASSAARGCSPVSSRSRLIRSTMGGWVDMKSLERDSQRFTGLVK